MDGGRLFTAVGLLRQARPGGFCPACRVLMKARGASQELAKPMVAAWVVLAVAGTRYGLSCLGCSAALMVAIVLLGMASLWWAVILGIVVLVYKFAPPLRMRNELLLSAALVALGVAYVMMA